LIALFFAFNRQLYTKTMSCTWRTVILDDNINHVDHVAGPGTGSRVSSVSVCVDGRFDVQVWRDGPR